MTDLSYEGFGEAIDARHAMTGKADVSDWRRFRLRDHGMSRSSALRAQSQLCAAAESEPSSAESCSIPVLSATRPMPVIGRLLSRARDLVGLCISLSIDFLEVHQHPQPAQTHP
jgi:hypothetical protein